jgi:osmotically-inducible protein OsmY
VTLRGTVDSEPIRQEAEQIARTVEGVTEVDNQLRIETARAGEPSPPERIAEAGRASEPFGDRVDAGWITTKIQAQYFVNPEIKPWNIDVTSTSDGVVRLEGEVDSMEDRQQAVTIARQTEGVTRVDDLLRVSGAVATTGTEPTMPARPDGWITTKVQSKYFLDDQVRGRTINVDTNDGVVTLAGTVGSEAERRQAVALAHNTDGVRDVQDRLTIQAEAAPTAGDTPKPVAGIEDTWITTKIQAQYFLDADVKGHQIDVDTRNGVVTLKGQLESEAARKEAEEIARQTEGVSRVVNQLTVGSAR